LLTRDNLLNLIEKYNLFENKKSFNTTTDLVEKLRKKIDIELVESDGYEDPYAPSNIAISFEVSFKYGDAETAYQVTDELVNMILNENARSRTQRVLETTDFLSREAEKQQQELEKMEALVADYKRRNAGSIPQNTNMQMAAIQRIESDLRETVRSYDATEAELRLLDTELDSAKAGIGVSAASSTTESNPAAELERLKTEYAKLNGVYSENHPTIRALVRKIETLEKSAASDLAKPAASAKDIMVAKVQARIDTAKRKLDSLADQRADLRSKLARLEGQVFNTPEAERGLYSLQRDYDNAKVKYDEIKSQLANAKIAQTLETENKAETYVLLESPMQAESPIEPKRKKIVAIGFFLAIAGAIGFAMLLEALDKRIWGYDALTSQLRMQPLVAIPYIATAAEVKRSKNMLRNAIIISILLVILALALLHFFITPLDILISSLF
jgi:succinoglycan biosynthesis transport protein ExoP